MDESWDLSIKWNGLFAKGLILHGLYSMRHKIQFKKQNVKPYKKQGHRLYMGRESDEGGAGRWGIPRGIKWSRCDVYTSNPQVECNHYASQTCKIPCKHFNRAGASGSAPLQPSIPMAVLGGKKMKLNSPS